MWCTRRAIQQTRVTEFHLHCVSIHSDILCPGQFEMRGSTIDPLHRRSVHLKCIITFWRPRVPGHNPGISAGCKEKEDHILHTHTSYVEIGLFFNRKFGVQHKTRNSFWIRWFTNIVSAIATTSTGYQETAGLSSLIRFLMMERIFPQNASAGIAIMKADRYKEDTSGPKINLPPQKNLYMIQTTIAFNAQYNKFK